VLAEFPFRLEPSLGLVGLPVRCQGPNHLLLLVPILGHDHSKQEPLASRVEMRRLSAIDGCPGAYCNTVCGADGYVELLLVIPVEVPKDHAEGSVGIALPPLKHWRDVLAPRILDL